MRLLVTTGATREPIDEIRFLSNFSTGATGAALATALAAEGHEVLALCGEGAVAPATGCEVRRYSSASNLADQLRLLLAGGGIRAIVHAAAVADYTPAHFTNGKIGSDLPALTLHLVPTPKILPQLKRWSPQPLQVVGFKLTATADPAAQRAAVEHLFARGGVDAVVHNDLSDYAGSGAERLFRLHHGPGREPVEAAGVDALAVRVRELLIRR